MGKYLVKHICGHEVEHQLYGKISDREKKAQWMKTIPCPDCKRAEDRAAAEKAAAETKATFSLPNLTGSEKQIAWAEDIRHGLIVHGVDLKVLEDAIRKNRSRVEIAVSKFGKINWPDNPKKTYSMSQQWIAARILATYTDSRWYIEKHRWTSVFGRSDAGESDGITPDDISQAAEEWISSIERGEWSVKNKGQQK